MKDYFKERSFVLFTKELSFSPESESDKSDNSDSNEEYNAKLYSSVAIIVKHYEKNENKKFNSARKFPAKSSSSTSKRSDAGDSKKDGGKCLNHGGADHFARDCKVKKNNPKDESYETKYKLLVASLKRQNLESKVLVPEEEEWIDDEESLNEEVKKDVCLMVGTGEFVIDENSSNSTTNGVDLVKLLVIQNFRTEIPHPCIRLKNL